MGRSRRLVGVGPKREEELYAALVNAAREQGYPVEGADSFAQQAIPQPQGGMTFAKPPDPSAFIGQLLMPILAGQFESMSPRGAAETEYSRARAERERTETGLMGEALAFKQESVRPENVLAQQEMRSKIAQEVKTLATAFQDYQSNPDNPANERAWKEASRNTWRLSQPEVEDKARQVADQPRESRAAEALSNFGSFMGMLSPNEYNELVRLFNISVAELMDAENRASVDVRPWVPRSRQKRASGSEEGPAGRSRKKGKDWELGGPAPLPSALRYAQEQTRGMPRIAQAAAGLAGLAADVPIGVANMLAGAGGWLSGTPEEDSGYTWTPKNSMSGTLPFIGAEQPEPQEQFTPPPASGLQDIAKMIVGNPGGDFGATPSQEQLPKYPKELPSRPPFIGPKLNELEQRIGPPAQWMADLVRGRLHKGATPEEQEAYLRWIEAEIQREIAGKGMHQLPGF